MMDFGRQSGQERTKHILGMHRYWIELPEHAGPVEMHNANTPSQTDTIMMSFGVRNKNPSFPR